MKTLLLLAILLGSVSAQEREDQYAVMVYESHCIEVGKDANTHAEFPMKNGLPDMKHGLLVHPIMKIVDPTCGHYEVRKVNSSVR